MWISTLKVIALLIKPVLFSVIAMLLGAGFAVSAETDDAAVFVEAFNAFQKQDYLLAIEKATQLNQAFPESSLKDVTMLLIARSGIKSGNNELAAKTIVKFRADFSDSALTSTIEDELLALGIRHQNGEQLQPNRRLQAAALKTREDQQALERAAALKLEQEKLAKEKAERDRIALEKVKSERRERDRLAAEKVAKESIKAVISIRDSRLMIAAGQNGIMPFEISNRGKNSEEFHLEVSAPSEYGALLAAAGKSDAAVSRIKLASGETFKGRALVRMPVDKIDGHRATLTIKAISSKYNDVTQVKSALVSTSAPFVRVVAKLAKPRVSPGDVLSYRVTVLNIGSQSAKELTVRVQLPPQLDFVDAPDLKFRQEKNGAVVFRVERIESGKLADITLNVKVRENSRIGDELRGQVEVVNGQLQRKDIFTASASMVQTK